LHFHQLITRREFVLRVAPPTRYERRCMWRNRLTINNT